MGATEAAHGSSACWNLVRVRVRVRVRDRVRVRGRVRVRLRVRVRGGDLPSNHGRSSSGALLRRSTLV